MNEEQIAKAREAESAEELLAMAKENGIEMTEEEAADLYDRLHSSTELTDDELEDVSGGCGSAITVDGVSYRKIKLPRDTICMTGQYKGERTIDDGWYCFSCDHFVGTTEFGSLGYCDIPY